MITLTVNGAQHRLDVDPSTPILWVVREQLKLTGTKFGCGIAQCGACTVHLNGRPIRSCVTPVAAAQGAQVTTIEGVSALSTKSGVARTVPSASRESSLHPVQQAWIDQQVPQCGYCQSGQIMSAVALLSDNPDPDDKEIDAAMRGNICRCGMYGRIRRAIKQVAASGVQVFDPGPPSDSGDSESGTRQPLEVTHG